MNKKVSAVLKMFISLGLGVLIIGLVARNFAKPLKLKLESAPFNSADTWDFETWKVQAEDYVFVGDTLGHFKDSLGGRVPLLSIYEGTVASTEIIAGSSVESGSVIAKVKVDIWKIVREAFARANYWWIVLSVVISLFSHLSRAIRWRMMFRSMGYNPSLGNAFGAILVMYISNLAFPRLGEVLRCSVIARYEKIPIHKSIGTMITERVIDVISLGVVLLLCLLLQYNVFVEFYNNYMPSQSSGYMKYIILGAGILGLVSTFFLYRAGKLPFGEKIKELAIGMWDGIQSVRNLEHPWWFLFHSIFIWVMYFFMTAVCLKALGETSQVSLLAGLPMLLFGGIAMVAVQGGLGLYPYFIGKVMLLYGVVGTVGYAFGWIIWSSQTVIILVSGLLAFLILPIVNKE